MAGGTRIVINDKGISLITGGKFEVKAGQHIFNNGQRVKAELPNLPVVNQVDNYTNKWDFYDLFYESNFSNVKYKLINNKSNTYISGTLDEHGRTQRINTSTNEACDILIGIDESWTVSVETGNEDDEHDYECKCGSHENHEHGGEI
ncbi:DUF2345 domain-containing protein [Acinetobacter seifertii]|uniref:DUF2345 domain-containing protein n=1 Tax=Acinetobacter seifertii TaxID=1530123 RepID=UPI001F062981|nr:DUF2345 domain-containing protein [Acinetobacter seifertii]MCH2001872.1 DUF2345 domain-containing protein [Acinetobacter seifertii]